MISTSPETSPIQQRVECSVCAAAAGQSPEPQPLRDGAVVLPLSACARHADLLRLQVSAALVRAGRQVTGAAGALRLGESSDGVRAWARAHGLPIAAHGSLSRAVLHAYRQAHPAAV